MTKRLLTELFPHFVKKSQTQRLAKGPFGEGLDAAELEKAGRGQSVGMRGMPSAEPRESLPKAMSTTTGLEKQGKRIYLKPGEQAPQGAQVQTGPRGGQYYDAPGGGGVGMESQVPPGQPGYYEPGEVEGPDSRLLRPDKGYDLSTMEGSQAFSQEFPDIPLDEDGYPPGYGASGEERKAKREATLAAMQGKYPLGTPRQSADAPQAEAPQGVNATGQPATGPSKAEVIQTAAITAQQVADAEGYGDLSDPENYKARKEFKAKHPELWWNGSRDQLQLTAKTAADGSKSLNYTVPEFGLTAGPGRDPNIAAGGLPNPMDYDENYGEDWSIPEPGDGSGSALNYLETAPRVTDIDGNEYINAPDAPGIANVPGLHGAADPIKALKDGGQFNENRMSPADRGLASARAERGEDWDPGKVHSSSYISMVGDRVNSESDINSILAQPSNFDEETAIADLTAQGYDLGIGMGFDPEDANYGKRPQEWTYEGGDRKPARTGEGLWKEVPNRNSTGPWDKTLKVLNIELPYAIQPTLAEAMKRDLEQQGFPVPPDPNAGGRYSSMHNREFMDEMVPEVHQFQPPRKDADSTKREDYANFGNEGKPYWETEGSSSWVNDAFREARGYKDPEPEKPAGYDIGRVPITIGEEITPEQEQALEDQRQSAGQPESETPKERYDKWKASIVPEVSEVTFDGEGNIQFPGAVDDRGRTTKRSISDLRERGVYDHETMNQLVDAYENETGANVPDIMQYDYVGSDVQAYRRGLNRDAWEDKINFATQNFGDKYDPNDIAEAESFLDWIESKDTSETQKMVKMMQTYNVDNKRRDPIVLSNKGGRQRR